MTINVVIVTKNFKCRELFESYFQNELTLKVVHGCELIDDNSLIINGETIFFDYLIISDFTNVVNLDKIHIIYENEHPITNFSLQTSINNVFAVSPFANCHKDLFEQFETIFDYIKNPY